MIWILDIVEIIIALWVVIVLFPKLSDKIDKLIEGKETPQDTNINISIEGTSSTSPEIITSLPSTEDRTLSPLNKDLQILKFKATDENDVEFTVILYVDKGTKKQSLD